MTKPRRYKRFSSEFKREAMITYGFFRTFGNELAAPNRGQVVVGTPQPSTEPTCSSVLCRLHVCRRISRTCSSADDCSPDFDFVFAPSGLRWSQNPPLPIRLKLSQGC